MSYIGNTNTTQGFIPAIDYFSGNGSTTAFTLSRPVASVAQVQAVVNNVAQNPSDAFTVSSNTITFTSAPSSGTNNIYVYYTSPITQVIAPSQGTVNSTSLASSTGSGAVVLATSPTLVTPALGTPSALVLTNATALPKAALPTGSVLQVVQAYITVVFSTTTNTAFVDITGLSVSITPTSASSKILVMATLTDCSTSSALGDGMFQVLRNSTAIGNASSGGTAPIMGYVSTYLAASANITDAVVFNYLDSPATTSSTTYKVQCRLWSNSGSGLDGTLYVGRRNGNGSFTSPSSITLMEIAA